MADQLELKVNVSTTGGESLDKLASSTKNLKEHTDNSSESIKKFGEHIRQHIETPVGTAYVSLGRLAESFGTVGFAAAAAGAVLGTAAIKAFELTEGFAKAAKEQSNFADRLGISIGRAQQFGAQAKLAGVDVGVLEASTRILATALEDSTGAGQKAYRALQQLGVATRTQAGDSREMGVVMLDVMDKLSKMEDQTKRTALGAAILGRSSKELQPLIKSYQETKEAAEQLGVGIDESGTKKLTDFHEAVTKAQIGWDIFLRSLAVRIAPITISIIGAFTPDPRKARGSGPQGYAFDSGSSGEPPPMPGAAVGFSMFDPNSAEYKDLQAGRRMAAANQANFANNSPEFIARQIASNKQEIGRLQGVAVDTDVGGAANQAATQRLKVLEADTQRLEIRLKTLEGAKTFPQEIQRWIDSMTSKELNPVEKIFAERDAMLARGRASGALTAAEEDAAGSAARGAAGFELGKMRDKYASPSTSFTTRTVEVLQRVGLLGGPTQQMGSEMGKAADETHHRLEEIFEKGVIIPLNQYAQNVGAAAIAANLGMSATNLSAGQNSIRQGVSGRAASRATAVRAGLAPTGSDVGGDITDRMQAENAIFELELAHIKFLGDQKGTAALKEFEVVKLANDADKKHALEVAQINMDAELAIEDLRAKDREQARALSGGFFDAMAGGALPGFFKSQGLGIAKTIFQNATTDIFGSSLSVVSPGQANSPIGKLLQGTPFGAKAVDIVTSSHTAAMDRHTGALIMASGGGTGALAGSLAAGGSFASSIPAIFGGTALSSGSTAPLSFFGGSAASPANSFLSAIGKAINPFAQGASSVLGGHGLSTLLGKGSGNGDTGGETVLASTGARVGAGVGLGVATLEGVEGVMAGVRQGGAQGITKSIGSAAMTASAFTGGPTNPVGLGLMIGGMAMGMISSLFGDPKAARESSIQHELTNAAFSTRGYIDERGNFVPGRQNKSIGYFGSSTGDSYDYNFRGGLRSGSQADTSRNTFDPSPNANQPKNGAVTINVTAMDSKSFLDHASDISAAVRKGVQMGHPLIQELQATLLPS